MAFQYSPVVVKKNITTKLPIRIISKPNTTKLIPIKKQSTTTIIKQIAAKPKASLTPSVLIRNKSVGEIKRPKSVKFITSNVTGESLNKINSLRGVGKDKILVIVGNGPSLLEIPTNELRNNDKIDIMSINKPDDRLWPTTYWVFFDATQLRRHEIMWNDYNGYIFNSTSIKARKNKSIQVKNLHGKGFSKDLTIGLHIGRSSVYAAMQIALWLDYKHIYIVGVDMNPSGGKDGRLHFYGVSPDVKPEIRASRFEKEAEHYQHAAENLDESIRKRYTFCSSYLQWPFAKHFNIIDHADAVKEILAAI